MMLNEDNKIKFNTAFLTSGNDFYITNDIVVKHPKLSEIYDLGNKIDCENTYWSYVSTLLCDPYSNMVMLDDLGIDYENQTPFDVFIINWKKTIKLYNENREIFEQIGLNPLSNITDALRFFLGDRNFSVIYDVDNNCYLIIDINSLDKNGQYTYIITPKIFDYIHEFIVVINHISNSDRINPADDFVKKMLIEDMREELKIHQKRAKEDLNAIGYGVNVICAGGNGSVNYLNIRDYGVYHILMSSKITMKQLHFNYLMQGVYSGNVDFSKINKNELNWAE